MRLFHLVPGADWQAFLASGATRWEPASLAAEGFVHLSFAEQLAGTLGVHFGGHDTVVLLEVEVAAAAELVIEPSRGGADFPHLYRGLELAECAGHWLLTASAVSFEVPQLASAAAADVPQRTPGAGTAP